ncbi:unnamed protein product, partial [Adineta ricciae]
MYSNQRWRDVTDEAIDLNSVQTGSSRSPVNQLDDDGSCC